MTGRSVSAAGPSLHGLVLAEKSDKSKFQIPLLPFTEHVRIYNYNLTIIYIYIWLVFVVYIWNGLNLYCIKHISCSIIFSLDRRYTRPPKHELIPRISESEFPGTPICWTWTEWWWLQGWWMKFGRLAFDIVEWSNCSALFSTRRFGDPETDLNIAPSCCFSMILRFHKLLRLRHFETRQGNIVLCLSFLFQLNNFHGLQTFVLYSFPCRTWLIRRISRWLFWSLRDDNRLHWSVSSEVPIKPYMLGLSL